MTNMNLPDELLLHFFQYLGLKEIKAVRRVCRRWYTISNDHTIWDGFELVWRIELQNYKFVRNIICEGISGCVLEDIQQMSLHTLNLARSYMADGGLKFIQHMPLHTLNLACADISDKELEYIQYLPLRRLDLKWTDITDEGLKYLQKMPLRILNLGWTNITDDGLKYLQPIPLYMLILINTNIANEAEARTILSHVPNLFI